MRFVRAALIALFLNGLMGSGVANAQYGPYNNQGIYNGIAIGWGWYPIVAGVWYWDWYGYPAWNPYGYSYWGYWNYQPYYATYGAISYSPATDRFGLAWGQTSRNNAAAMSLGYCDTDDCSPVVWVQGGCAAIARSPDSDFVGWGYHTTRYDAQAFAMRVCRDNNIGGCQIKAWVCSF